MKYVLVFCPDIRDDISNAFDWDENPQASLEDELIDGIDEFLNRACLRLESYAFLYQDVR